MGVRILVKRIFLGKRIFKLDEEVEKLTRDRKRGQERKAAKKEMLVAVAENEKIRVKDRKIRKKSRGMIGQLRPKFKSLEIKINSLLESRGR